jgi:hypothetical protein
MSRSALSDEATGLASLVGEVTPVRDLSPAERAAMLALMDAHFLGVTRAGFEADLAEKEWAIVLREAGSGAIRGFSTLMRLDAEVGEERAVAFFSGDTIVDRRWWGRRDLARTFGRHVFEVGRTVEGRAFWFLISSGYKTYRFLPVFFKDFFPAHDRATPRDQQARLDALARRKFGVRYDARTGIVRLPEPTPLRPGVADLDARRLEDPHVAFFAARNPGHARGDELACLAELSSANLTPLGRRFAGV